MNLVEYYTMLKQEARKVEDFLIAAKSISAGDSDLPDNALKMIASDSDMAEQFYDSFGRIERGMNSVRLDIINARLLVKPVEKAS